MIVIIFDKFNFHQPGSAPGSSVQLFPVPENSRGFSRFRFFPVQPENMRPVFSGYPVPVEPENRVPIRFKKFFLRLLGSRVYGTEKPVKNRFA